MCKFYEFERFISDMYLMTIQIDNKGNFIGINLKYIYIKLNNIRKLYKIIYIKYI